MTDRLEDIKARRAAITPGPWVAGWMNDWKGTKAVLVCLDGDNVDSTVTRDIDHRDAEFIAHAPDDIDWLLSEVERRSRGSRLSCLIRFVRRAKHEPPHPPIATFPWRSP